MKRIKLQLDERKCNKMKKMKTNNKTTSQNKMKICN